MPHPPGLKCGAVEDQLGLQPVNGLCRSIHVSQVYSDIMLETLKRTNLGLLCAGGKVNLERPLTMEKFLGGHLVQGHIDDTGRIASVTQQGETTLVRVEAPPEIMRYIVEKGFIAVDGISLTVVNIDAGSFTVSVVEYTLENTILGNRHTGDMVNLEVDIIAKYVERFNKSSSSGITIDLLKEHGFITG